MRQLISFFFIFFLALLSPQAASADQLLYSRLPLYSASSRLASGKWVKVRVSQNGIYRISFDELRRMGFSSPANVRVFGYGGRRMDEEFSADNYLDDLPPAPAYYADGFLLFYGFGPEKWYTKNNSIATSALVCDRNPYSNYGYYFLSDVDPSVASVPLDTAVYNSDRCVNCDSYTARATYQPNLVNMYLSGSVWSDVPIVGSGSRRIQFSFPNKLDTSLAFASFSFASDGCSGKSVTLYDDKGISHDVASGSSLSRLPQSTGSSSSSYRLQFSNSSASGLFYINYLTASAECDLTLKNVPRSFLEFRRTHDVFTGRGDRFRLRGADDNTIIWDITYANNVLRVPFVLHQDTAIFSLPPISRLRELVAFNPNGSGFLSIDSSGVVMNQDLHSLPGADYVIIAPPFLAEQAGRLGRLHYDAEDLSYIVVDPAEIYNEFGSGMPDPTAIRTFVKMLFDRGNRLPDSHVAPRYLLLFGDGTYDNRGVVAKGDERRLNVIPTLQSGTGEFSFPNDDYYGMCGDGSLSYNSCLINVGVGRLPVSSLQQAKDVVDKVESYMKNEQYGEWKNKITFIADDNETVFTSLGYHDFLHSCERLCNTALKYDKSLVYKKIYYDCYNRTQEASGRHYRDVERLFLKTVNDGSMIINYVGHSNPINISEEKTFTQSQVASLENRRLGIWITASCDFSEFDNLTTSIGEALVLRPQAGAIAVIGSPRPTYSGENEDFNSNLLLSFYKASKSPYVALGDIMREAKTRTLGTIREKYPLLGDPALLVTTPKYNVVTDSVSTDTASAMAKVSVWCHLSDAHDSLLSQFNGTVKINVFDKMQVCNTKGNNSANGSPLVTTYKDYPNVLFQGSASVSNGLFSFSFIVPNDIFYTYGNGRVVYYAWDEQNNLEASGCYDDLVIGGSRPVSDQIADNLGPDAVVTINSPSFRNGDKVGDEPVLIARVSDANGINASDVGIGHNITVQVDGADPVSVNQFFSYDVGSCSSGVVSYRLEDLSPGVHSVVFKVWDLLNNSSTRQLSFVTTGSDAVHVEDVSFSPNPAVSSTVISVSHDCPMSLVSYSAQVCDLMGRTLASFKGEDYSAGYSLQIPLNVSSLGLQPGVYLVRVSLNSPGSYSGAGTGKLIVLPQ